jgi:hypothetical protein
MARAVFYVNIGEKTRKRTIVIDDKLAVLNDVVTTLNENDIVDDDDIEACPFNVCYNHLALKCTEIGTKAFRIPFDDYWAEFVNLTDEEEDEEICFAVFLAECKIIER